MNRILILSDSHSDISLKNIIEKESYDCVLHAGDSQLSTDDPLLEKINYIIRGNCDFTSFKNELTLKINNLGNIYITHGHLLNVKFNLDKITYLCLENKINLCIYGHTHIVHIEYLKENDLLILNPGSTAFGRSKYKNTYIILEYSTSLFKVILKNAKTFELIQTFNFSRT